jgi:D-alanine--poly(phosphoribitol) ligase subunit 1
MKYDFQNETFVEPDKNPEKIAIAGSDKEISWVELSKLTKQLSTLFSTLQIPKGQPILIYGHKEAFFPISMLACMHSGLPYIPIDKIYPSERIKKIIETTGAQILVNCSDVKLDLDIAISISSRLEVQRFFEPVYSGNWVEELENRLFYIMFTSGSTGEPKGVQIARNSVLAFIKWANKDFGFSEKDVFLNQAPFTFDVSLCDVLNAFSLGGTLVLNSTEIVKEAELFFARIQKYKCSVWTSTPSFAYLFLRHQQFTIENLSSLHTFLFMGEELPNRSVGILKTNFPNARMLNAYGPTEATIVTTLLEISKEHLSEFSSLPIGYAMPGSTLLLEKLNPNDKEGELVIVGEHVSLGYFKKEELNAEKFFIHKEQRAFRTGDLAYHENGLYFYLGRNDDQIKMNGFRIELNEISNVLCRVPGILDSVTVALKRNKEVKKIISFVLLKNPLSKEEVLSNSKSYLEKTLPYYMIPGDFVEVAEFPYSSSHKIDKNKLIESYLENQLKK